MVYLNFFYLFNCFFLRINLNNFIIFIGYFTSKANNVDIFLFDILFKNRLSFFNSRLTTNQNRYFRTIYNLFGFFDWFYKMNFPTNFLFNIFLWNSHLLVLVHNPYAYWDCVNVCLDLWWIFCYRKSLRVTLNETKLEFIV